MVPDPHGTKHAQGYTPGLPVLKEKVMTFMLPAGAAALSPSSGTKTPRSGMANVWAAVAGAGSGLKSPSCGLPLSSKYVMWKVPPSMPKACDQNGLRRPEGVSSWSICSVTVEFAGAFRIVGGRELTQE